jgi:hypothetical protein
VRGAEDYYNFKQYIRRNPVKQGLVAAFADYPYSSARPEFVMDEVPQRLKPSSFNCLNRGAEALRHPKACATQNLRYSGVPHGSRTLRGVGFHGPIPRLLFLIALLRKANRPA